MSPGLHSKPLVFICVRCEPEGNAHLCAFPFIELGAHQGKFKAREDFDLDEYLKGSFTVFKGEEDYEVVIDFDIWATDLIRDRKWHSTQQFTEMPNGCSSLQMRLNNIEEKEQWVLSWGIHATVVRPAELVDRIRNTAEGLMTRYAKLQNVETVRPSDTLCQMACA